MSNRASRQWLDGCGREINYLRLSVTDRCNFRCVYCMAEDMRFLPKQRLLNFEEIVQICSVMSELGVSKIRLTGGEPLVRHDIVSLATALADLEGIDKLAMTTNGARLPELAKPLQKAGVQYVNISLDTLDAEQFRRITRTGELTQVLDGIQAAQDAGFERVKLNAVIVPGENDQAVLELLDFALGNQLDISFIEEMPMGAVSSEHRLRSYCSSDEVKSIIQQHHELLPTMINSGGPSRYFSIPGYASRIGFISPISNSFCASCNRVRMTAEGKLILCLGNESALDLKALVRNYPGQSEKLRDALISVAERKPKQHYFKTGATEQLVRFMNMTGG